MTPSSPGGVEASDRRIGVGHSAPRSAGSGRRGSEDLRVGEWPPDSQFAVSKHGDAPGELHELGLVEELLERSLRCREGLIVQSEHEDARVRAGRVRANVTEASIQRDDESVLGSGGPAYRRVIDTEWALVENCFDVVARGCENRDQCDVEPGRSGRVIIVTGQRDGGPERPAG